MPLQICKIATKHELSCFYTRLLSAINKCLSNKCPVLQDAFIYITRNIGIPIVYNYDYIYYRYYKFSSTSDVNEFKYTGNFYYNYVRDSRNFVDFQMSYLIMQNSSPTSRVPNILICKFFAASLFRCGERRSDTIYRFNCRRDVVQSGAVLKEFGRHCFIYRSNTTNCNLLLF